MRLLLVLLLIPSSASAVTVLIGDPDGFGIEPAGLFRATNPPGTDAADTDGDGILEPLEFLPDWNVNGSCAVGSNDTFDFREPDEVADTLGAQWTDHSVEGGGAADGATFLFSFPVPIEGDFDFGVLHYVNFIFGDYDVVPTTVVIDGTQVPLTIQGSGNDGMVQATFSEVPWEAMTDGELVVSVDAPNEPYLAFDYALLAQNRVADSDGDGIPDAVDNCPSEPNLDQADGDGDGAGDACDLCPDDWDPEQLDSDLDGAGDACDPCPEEAPDDADGDGFCAPEDCMPEREDVHPSAAELCDGLDNDCNGTPDDLPDGDGDGVGPCEDCDDADPGVSPLADEVCDDGVDQDCDGADETGCADDDDDLAVPDNPDGSGLQAQQWGGGCDCDDGGSLAWLLPLLFLRRRGSGRLGVPDHDG